MKRISVIFFTASLFANIAFAEDNVVATYKGGKVTASQVMQMFKNDPAMQGAFKDKKFTDFDQNLQQMIVRGYLDTQLLEQEAKNSGIESSKEFQDKMAKVSKQMLTQELLDNYVKSHVTEKMANAEYDKEAADLKGKDQVKVSHILIDSEKEAKNIKGRLNKGEKFAKLAKDFSKDDRSKSDGGNLGYVLPGKFLPELENKTFSMKVNEVSGPIPSRFGYHIIMVTDRKPAEMPPKEQVMAEIKNKLNREAIAQYIADLEKKADVKIMLPEVDNNKDKDSKTPDQQEKK